MGNVRAKVVLKGKRLVEEEELEVQPQLGSHLLIDEKVDVGLVRNHLTEDAWLLLEDVLKQKRKRPCWCCAIFLLNEEDSTEGTQWIQCDRCLEWVHLACVATGKRVAAQRAWFCCGCSAMLP